MDTHDFATDRSVRTRGGWQPTKLQTSSIRSPLQPGPPRAAKSPRDTALRLQTPIDLRAAGVHPFRQLRLGDALAFDLLAASPTCVAGAGSGFRRSVVWVQRAIVGAARFPASAWASALNVSSVGWVPGVTYPVKLEAGPSAGWAARKWFIGLIVRGGREILCFCVEWSLVLVG